MNDTRNPKAAKPAYYCRMKFALAIRYIALSMSSALLLIASWLPYGLAFCVLFALVPLLWVEQQLRLKNKGNLVVFAYGFTTFFLWNIGTTWWLWNATPEGAIAAFLINTLLMCLPWMFYHWAAKKRGTMPALWLGLWAWLVFEWMHRTWEFSWPWLNLGNVFATTPWAVQWYELSGVTGGSFWILLSNGIVFNYTLKWQERVQAERVKYAFNHLFWILIAPLFLSWYMHHQYQSMGTPLQVTVVQPNIDPYTDKFEGMSPIEQTNKMLNLASQQTTPSTHLICFPETALVGGLNEESLETEPEIAYTRKYLEKYPYTAILSGADTYRFFADASQRTPTARHASDDNYYDSYNTALLIQQNKPIEVYHKSKLVPGVEAIPYQQYLQFLSKAAIDLGGTSGSLGRSQEAINFNINSNQQIAPIICYESVFGEHVSSYVLKGAGILCIITNDGWWGNSPGHIHHFDYARLRAIENRRFVARSANTGTSGFIDDKGNIMQESAWWEPTVLSATLQYQTYHTFYTKHAWFIERLPLLLLVLAVLRWRNS